ncbi:lamin tail domain-containing protein [candidate division KSB1 bacterium]|nr:lamin tail domain-containing protein [candidate division KSB1 bacterium]
MKKTIVSFCVLFLISPCCFIQILSAQITFTEIMFDPVANENYYEYLEIYNQDNGFVDLTSWSVGDNDASDNLIAANDGLMLGPNQYAIILDPGYFENDGIYDNAIPPDALVLTIDGATFGNSGLSNSVAETIILFNASGDTISKYQYTLDNLPGYSDEKIRIDGPNIATNWGNSSIYGGTPGGHNSLSPTEVDISITIANLSTIPQIGDMVQLDFIVRNIGFQVVGDYNIQLYRDVDFDSTIEASELINSIPMNSLAQGDSAIESISIESIAGFNQYIAYVELPLDGNVANNMAIASFKVGYARSSLIINEIMFKPLDGNMESIEVLNISNAPIDLYDWAISDEKTSARHRITEQHIWISPEEYVVISQSEISISAHNVAPESWPTLNNDNDTIVLYDLTGAVIDSVSYDVKTWPENVSLERIDPHWDSNISMNWSACKHPSGNTLGDVNSVKAPAVDLGMIAIEPHPGRIIPGESVVFDVIVENFGSEPVSNYTINVVNDVDFNEIFPKSEQIVSIQIDSTFHAHKQHEFELLWTNIPSGMHSIYCFVVADNDTVEENDYCQTSVRVGYTAETISINEIMFSPQTAEPEWFELFNGSGISVNLQHWCFSDSNTSKKIEIISEPVIVAANDFIVIASGDLSEIENEVIVQSFPSLNNSSDAVHIFDNIGLEIDYCSYSATRNKVGFSLERINPHISTSDPDNWINCVDPRGNTAGRQNSVFTERLAPTSSISVSPNPFSPDEDSVDDNLLIEYRLPLLTSAINVKIFDITGRMVRFLCRQRPAGSEGIVIWNGKDDNGRTCRMGIYIIYFEALSSTKGVLIPHKSTVVLAAPL